MCLRCSIGDIKPGQRKREKLVDRAEREEAAELQRADPMERAEVCGFAPWLDDGNDWEMWETDEQARQPRRNSPLRAPLGRVAHWSNRRCQWWKLARLIQAALLACVMVACTPAPAWMPGDPPLEVWAPDDAVWAAMERGCAAWNASVGLECERAADRESARVTARVGDLGTGYEGTRALTRARPDIGGWQLWEEELHVTFNGAEFLAQEFSFVAAHEVGHVIGVWEHLPESGCLMSWDSIASAVPTAADVDALLEVWGMTAEDL